MTASHLKTPFNQSLNRFAEGKIKDALQLTGKALPCSVVSVTSTGIVTIKFELDAAPFTLPQVTVPVAGSRYVRLPVQPGDLGMVMAADVRLGGVTGTGGGLATLSAPANLSALVFFWLGNAAWTVDDPQAVTITGPNGAVLQTDSGADKITVSSAGVRIKGKFGAFDTAPVAKPTITGTLSAVTDANAKLVLTSIIGALSALGLATNGTT